jgi:hypothetical protein
VAIYAALRGAEYEFVMLGERRLHRLVAGGFFVHIVIYGPGRRTRNFDETGVID